jgi:hypothetical protein
MQITIFELNKSQDMKKLALSIIAFTTAIALNAQSGAHIQFKMSSTKGMTGTMDINHSEYGSLTEMKMAMPQMPGGEMIIKSLSKKSVPDVSYTIDDKNKTYKEQKKSTTAPANKEEKDVTVKKLGNETINGYKCAHALITEGTNASEVWNTKDFPDYDKYNEAMSDNKRFGTSKNQKALKDAGCEGFPVKMIKKGVDGTDEMSMELVKFEKKSFSASDFEIPAGYTKTEAPANPYGAPAGMKTQDEIMKMSPEERAKYIEELKKKYGK